MKQEMGKSLIVYYSRSDENYFGGKIVNLAVGNTAIAAEKLKHLTGADIFEIVPVKGYPANYTRCTEVAQMELNAGSRPEFIGDVPHFASYDTIYVGYPNWWGTMPMVVMTFLEKYDFGGKKIFPFCTNEGSGMGSSEHDIRRLCPTSQIGAGLSVRGSNVKNCDELLAKWIKSHEF